MSFQRDLSSANRSETLSSRKRCVEFSHVLGGAEDLSILEKHTFCK
ncbi:hypothetical protein LEP1GSC021_0598 [Leptospira noguchii str. 1993005606]|nr:hypothetical protein LEP1GSC021_0598 [Leptospira noguchii str. 1993005606]